MTRQFFEVGAVLVLLAAFSGCGTLTDGGYVMVSEGEAGLVESLFVGGVKYCKITSSNPDYEFTEDDRDLWRQLCSKAFEERLVNAVLQ